MSDRVSRALIIVLMLSSGATAQTTPAVKALPEIQLDLNSRTTGGVLPFDAPFALTGTVPDRVTRVTATYGTCDKASFLRCKRGDCDVSTVSGAAGCELLLPANVTLKPPLVWVRDPILSVATSGAVPMRLVVPELEAMHHYLFKFDVEATVPDADLKAFRDKARVVLETQFAQFPNGDILKAMFPETRKALIAALKRAAGQCIRIDAPNTPLDENVDFDHVEKEFTDLMTAAVEAPAKVKVRTKEVREVIRRDLNTSLQNLRAPLQVIVGAVNGLKKDDPTRLDLEGRPAILALARLSPLELSDLSNGADPAAPAPTEIIPELPTEPDAVARATDYRRLEIVATQIDDWLAQLKRSGTEQQLINDNKITQQNVDEAEANALDVRDHAHDGNRRLLEIITLTEARQGVLVVANKLMLVATSGVTIVSSTLGTFDTFSHYYVTADAGVLYAPEIRNAVPYLGTNFYLRPVNRDVSLTKKSSFGRRFALTAGLTMRSVEDAQKVRRADLFGTQSLLIGAGYRITDIFRIGAGALIFNRKDPNPLIKTQRLGSVPYATISFDWDLAKTFGGLSKLFQ